MPAAGAHLVEKLQLLLQAGHILLPGRLLLLQHRHRRHRRLVLRPQIRQLSVGSLLCRSQRLGTAGQLLTGAVYGSHGRGSRCLQGGQAGEGAVQLWAPGAAGVGRCGDYKLAGHPLALCLPRRLTHLQSLQQGHGSEQLQAEKWAQWLTSTPPHLVRLRPGLAASAHRGARRAATGRA